MEISKAKYEELLAQGLVRPYPLGEKGDPSAQVFFVKGTSIRAIETEKGLAKRRELAASMPVCDATKPGEFAYPYIA